MLCYNNDVESFCERLSTAPSRINLSSKFISREGLQMLNNQKPTPVLIKDLGMLYSTKGFKRKYHYGLYRCQCGNEFKAQTAVVKNGNTNSCGCYRNQRTKEVNITHGLSDKHPLYNTRSMIIQRTTNQRSKDFKYYGGRGITICDEWKNDFKAFYDWSIINGYQKGLEIDRIDNNKGYSHDNCRFVTRSINTQNTRILKSNNTSGYRGVSLDKASNNWRVRIQVYGKSKYLGLFKNAKEAAIAYDTYVVKNNLEHTRNFKEAL